MGSNWSSPEEEPSPDVWWPTERLRSHPISENVVGEEKALVTESAPSRGSPREELEIFKQELARKRALRHEALAALQAEMNNLRSKVEEERSLRQKAEEERDRLKTEATEELQLELEKLKEENKKLLEERERLTAVFEEKTGLERQVQALKDVSEIGKEMLRIRELQVKELKKKLVEINLSSVMAPPEDLRVEYEKQIENIRKLRTLYEERAAATLLEHRRELEREEARIAVLEIKLSDLQKETDEYKEVKKELEEKITKLEKTIQDNENELQTTKDDLFSSIVQNKNLNSQLTVINNLFSQMLVSPDVDLDRITRVLRDHHGLITDMTTTGDSNDVAALLVDLAGQVEKEHEAVEKDNLIDFAENASLKSEIASNLSKVWRVMVELLSHHKSPTHTEFAGGADSCYKCIQTPAGPKSVISVSQTFLTLKDLILEKNRLVKEVGRLKTLNNHLEHRLGNQEKRLSVVTTELRKTWGVVNKLKAQHKQLHTHEKILRYELQQKRCMLTELKEELEHCRDKWERARQKNSQTEEDWKKLRKEFAARKSRQESNSAESGYEEDDVQSPPSEPINQGAAIFEIAGNDVSEPDLSEEDIEHSDGNSFDTVIDLLDIACIESQSEGESEIPFVVCEAPNQPSDMSPSLLPLSRGEFTEGLDQIESEDLAAVLDVQYQNQLLGADYNLSLPSSSGSSPIPTENDDLASSEIDISEEDLSSNDNHIHSSPLTIENPSVPEDSLLFGSNSSRNISKFLDGLFVDEQTNTKTTTALKLIVNVPSTSQSVDDDDDSVTPIVCNGTCYQFNPGSMSSSTQQYNSNESSPNVQSEESEVGKLTKVNGESKNSCAGSATLCSTQDQEEVCKDIMSGKDLSTISPENKRLAQEEMLKAREEKLKRLEQQCRSLVSKVTSTSFRSEIISNKLDELHLCYGPVEETAEVTSTLNSNERNDDTSDASINTLPNSSSYFKDHPDKSTSFDKMNSKDEERQQVSTSHTQYQNQNSPQIPKRTPEEILEARTLRLKRLEDQCKSLFSKMSATSSRSDLLSNKLDELHESYGPSEQKVGTEKPTIEAKVISPSQEENSAAKPVDLSLESKAILNKCSPPGTSADITPGADVTSKKGRTPEEILEARAERFRRLEEQCKSLVSKMTATSLRSEIISNKLDELHSCYGSSEDASDTEELHSVPKEVDSNSNSPSSRYSNAITTENSIPLDAQSNGLDSISERVTLSLTADPGGDKDVINSSKPDTSKRTPDEILQARAERLDRLEKQCKSLFSQMSATSDRSDAISNRLEELHEQYGQPSTSDQIEPTTLTPVSIESSLPDGREEMSQGQSTNNIEIPIETSSHITHNSDAVVQSNVEGDRMEGK